MAVVENKDEVIMTLYVSDWPLAVTHINMQYFTTDTTDNAIIKMFVLDDFYILQMWISGPYACIYIVQV
jgi:hypothetical protein